MKLTLRCRLSPALGKPKWFVVADAEEFGLSKQSADSTSRFFGEEDDTSSSTSDIADNTIAVAAVAASSDSRRRLSKAELEDHQQAILRAKQADLALLHSLTGWTHLPGQGAERRLTGQGAGDVGHGTVDTISLWS